MAVRARKPIAVELTVEFVPCPPEREARARAAMSLLIQRVAVILENEARNLALCAGQAAENNVGQPAEPAANSPATAEMPAGDATAMPACQDHGTRRPKTSIALRHMRRQHNRTRDPQPIPRSGEQEWEVVG